MAEDSPDLESMGLGKAETSIADPATKAVRSAARGLGILQQTGVVNPEGTGPGVNAAELVQPLPDIGAIQNTEVLRQIEETSRLGRLRKVGANRGNPIMEDPENGARITLRLGANEGEFMAPPPTTFTHPNLDRELVQRERSNIAGFTEAERKGMTDAINAIPNFPAEERAYRASLPTGLSPDQIRDAILAFRNDRKFALVMLGNARMDLQATVVPWTEAFWDYDNNHDRNSQKYREKMGIFQLYNDGFVRLDRHGNPRTDGGRDTLGRTEGRRLIENYPGVSDAIVYIQSMNRGRLYWTSSLDPGCVARLMTPVGGGGSGLDIGTATVATQLAKKLLIVSGEANFTNSNFPRIPGVPGFQSQARIEAVQDLGKNLFKMFEGLFKVS